MASDLCEIERTEPARSLFLFLDEALGEFGTGQWIGEIKVSDRRLAEAIPLQELPAYIDKLAAETGWKKYPPGECATVYRLNEKDGPFLRGDLIAGTSMNMQLINEYLRSEGKMADPLAGTGADYVFVAFDAGILPEGKQVDARGVIEDGLDSALRAECSGRLMGGGLGREFAYVDLLIFDGHNSLDIIQRTLREQPFTFSPKKKQHNELFSEPPLNKKSFVEDNLICLVAVCCLQALA